MSWEHLIIFKKSWLCAWTSFTAIISILCNWKRASSLVTMSKFRLSAFVTRNLGIVKRLLKRVVVCLLEPERSKISVGLEKESALFQRGYC